VRKKGTDARELGNEPEADRQQIRRHADQRAAFRNRHKIKAERAKTEVEMREFRESFARRRRTALASGIARLFAARPEYRGRRVGQITCALIHYIGEDFPRGGLGAPKDAEVEAILEGVEAA
jgi:hypothetical protein